MCDANVFVVLYCNEHLVIFKIGRTCSLVYDGHVVMRICAIASVSYTSVLFWCWQITMKHELAVLCLYFCKVISGKFVKQKNVALLSIRQHVNNIFDGSCFLNIILLEL